MATPRAIISGPTANGSCTSLRKSPVSRNPPLPNTANASPLHSATRLSKARREQPKPVSAASEAVAAAPVRPSSSSELPEDLRNPVVVLQVPNTTAEGGVTSVYLLGISHVAKSDCKRVRDLIKLVQPEVVMVELCKERTGLLVDPNAAGGSSTWHTNTVAINGLPQGKGWPSAEQLLGALRARPGASVSIAEIEEDCDRLAASGLFRTARPRISPPGPRDAPNFRPEILPSGKERLSAVSAMGSLTFEVTERILPPVTQCSVEMSEAAAEALSQDAARGIAKGLVDACANGASTVGAALATRADLLEAAREAGLGAMDVVVDGIDTGKVTLKLRALPETCKAELTGLESSARDGSGWGIEPLARKSSASSSSPKTRKAASEAATPWKPWPASSIPAGAASAQTTANPLQEAFGSAVTRAYAALQADAGRTVGIPPGAAWRAALEQAVAEGAQQVHLGDRPTDVTRRRLVAGITDGMAVKTIGAAALLAGTVAAAALGALPESAEAPMVAAASAAAGVALWPLLGPLVEVGQFAKLSAAEIEETVRVKQPLQDSACMLKLWGEDAIVDFPGASQSIIDERDLYMAKALHAAATGQEGVSPAYVLTDAADTTYRYLMPEDGMELGCPSGSGDGTYEPLKGVGAVVGVVGTAHVHGIVKYWESSAAKPQKDVLSDLL